MRDRLRGWSDIGWVLFVSAVIALMAMFLLDHLRTRHGLYQLARERSHEAWLQRGLIEQQRHLELERRIRVGALSRGEGETTVVPPSRIVTIDEEALGDREGAR